MRKGPYKYNIRKWQNPFLDNVINAMFILVLYEFTLLILHTYNRLICLCSCAIQYVTSELSALDFNCLFYTRVSRIFRCSAVYMPNVTLGLYRIFIHNIDVLTFIIVLQTNLTLNYRVNAC